MPGVYIRHLLTVQQQWEETLPVKVASCLTTHRCKVSHPSDLTVLPFLYATTREQNLLLYDLSVSLHIDRATMTACQTQN